MENKDFTIGTEFLCGDKCWRCTDLGIRPIVAICLEDVNTSSGRTARK
jgi:hypothetical protein